MSPIPRRQFLCSTAAAVAASSRVEASQSPLSVGLMADAQYADVPTKGTRHYRRSIRKLEEAVAILNRHPLDFSVHLGDLIDRDWSSFSRPLTALRSLRAPCFQILGNHDYSVAENRLAEVPARLGMKSNYFARSTPGYRFLFLDTNEVSTYAHAPGSPQYKAAAGYLAQLKKRKAAQAQPWNGGLSETQLAWFSAQCEAASQEAQRIVVFAHHPVFPDGSHNIWNSPALIERIDQHPCIAAWFNGHNHAGNYQVRNGVHYITLHGIVETRDQSALAVARFLDGSIELEGFGREPSRSLVLTA